MSESKRPRLERPLPFLLLAAALAALYVVSRLNYLLFHGLTELFSIVVAVSVFVIAWSAQRYLETGFLLILGVAHLFIGLLGLLHLLAFPGMSVFTVPGYPANQLWIATRYLEALSFLTAFAFLSVRRRPNALALLAVFGSATAAVLACIFRWRSFPVCFVEGIGQTSFKIVSEYVVIGLLAASLGLLHAKRHRFAARVRRTIAASLLASIAAGVAFSLYADPYGTSNLVGHLFRLVSVAMIYVALVDTCLDRPFDLVFRELNLTNARLSAEIEARKVTERVKDEAMRRLQAATDEIRTLRGIIPICSHCKKIRDDRGAWNQMEAYLQRHSEAQFSHGLCPDCVSKWFPEASGDSPPAPGPAAPAVTPAPASGPPPPRWPRG